MVGDKCNQLNTKPATPYHGPPACAGDVRISTNLIRRVSHAISTGRAPLVRAGVCRYKRPMIIWTDTRLDPTRLARGHEIRRDIPLADADIAFGQPDPKLVLASPRVKWVHITSAGYTKYDTPEFFDGLRARGAAMTNSSSVFNEPCAQHVLAMMLAFSRQLPAALDAQRTDRGWKPSLHRSKSFLLRGQTVLIYGYGAIGQRLTEMLKPFEMQIFAVRRTPAGTNQFSPEAADELLGKADHIVNTLPASPSTRQFFNADRLGRIRRAAYFYNIGRGDTVDQAALVNVLPNLAGVYLDVTSPEPLPPDSPLWTAPNCFITPHSGGGHFNENDRLITHFAENLRRFTAGHDLLDRVV